VRHIGVVVMMTMAKALPIYAPIFKQKMSSWQYKSCKEIRSFVAIR
jgi:hypothetical protein